METVSNYFGELEQMLRAIVLTDLRRALDILEDAYYQGRHMFIMGNGGAAPRPPRTLRWT